MSAEIPATSEDDRKLFVGGLPQEAKDTDIKEYFGQYGEIDNINLKTDPHTGRSRGFAFIVFKEADGLSAASAQEAHVIKGKKVTCKKAEAKQGKIYVGKLPAEGVTVEDIQTHFAQFGPVAEVVRPIDKSKNDEPKNFCFVTFEREETAKQMVKEGSATINGHQIDIKKVTPKDNNRGGFGGRGGRGGFGEVMVDMEDTQILMHMEATDTEIPTHKDMVVGMEHPWDTVVALEQGERCEEDLVDEDVVEVLEGADHTEYLR